MTRKTVNLSFRIDPKGRTAFMKAAKEIGSAPSDILRSLVAGFLAGNIQVAVMRSTPVSDDKSTTPV